MQLKYKNIKRPKGFVGKVLPVVVEPPLSWDLFRDGITQSLLSTYLLCPERARLAYSEMWSPREVSEPIEFGNIVHESLEAIYKWVQSNPVSSDIPDVLIDIENRWREEKNLDPFLQEKWFGWAYAVLKGYFQKWGDDLTSLDWVALEKEFSVDYRGIKVRGKIDGVFRAKDGKLWIYDTKTKGQIDEEAIANTLGYDIQVNLYMWAASQIYGEEVAGCVYNVIRRPQLRQGARESLADYISRVDADVQEREDFYFVRFMYEPKPEERYLWQRDFQTQLSNLMAWDVSIRGSNVISLNYRNPMSCYAKGPCPFIPVCSANDYSTLIKREVVFPELSGEG